MTKEIMKQDGGLNGEQIALLKRTVAQGATNDELSMFIHVAKKSGLDPFANQIHFVKRAGKATIQTGIDGYRLAAARSGEYAGNDDPVYDDEKNPKKASVTVYRMVGGQRCGFTATARWDQYFPGEKQGFMWKKMPHLMLGKCAEALALRKAFPAELSGIYTNEEMEQAGKQPHVESAPPAYDESAAFAEQGPFPNAPEPVQEVEVKSPRDWKLHQIHFGKNKGVCLGDLQPQQLKWYVEQWQPNPEYADDRDAALRSALDQAGLEDGDLPVIEVTQEDVIDALTSSEE